MIEPKMPSNERERMKALRSLNLGKQAEQKYDQITKLAAYICETPISLISLIGKDKNWYKSKVGIEIAETPRKYSHCGHAILDPKRFMEIPDTRKDKRFKDNPFTLAKEPIIFYSGVPLIDKKGHALGTLCVLDKKPRELNNQQKQALQYLANQVTFLFELKKQNNYLKKVEKDLLTRNEELKNFAGVVSHDMKMPLANIVLTVDVIKKKYAQNLPEQAIHYLNNLKNSSFSLNDYISGILDHYESDKLFSKSHHKWFGLNDLLEKIVDLLNITEHCKINFPEKNKELHSNEIALEQILLNLINNSLKYNDKKETVIDISCEEENSFYVFEVKDNGIGIPKNKKEEVFKLFSTATDKDKNGVKGNGIGLSTVKKLIENLGGTVSIDSELGVGTHIHFTVKKPKGRRKTK